MGDLHSGPAGTLTTQVLQCTVGECEDEGIRSRAEGGIVAVKGRGLRWPEGAICHREARFPSRDSVELAEKSTVADERCVGEMIVGFDPPVLEEKQGL